MTNLTLFQKTRGAGHSRPTQEIERQSRRKSEFDGKIISLDIVRIAPNPAQPRRSFDNDALIRLADSIRQYGILQPLTVRRISDALSGESTKNERFELIAGERRLRAAKLLGMLSVPCIVVDVSDRASAELAIIENVQRENLNMFEQASAIASLIDIYSLTQEQVAKRLSLSQSYVANKLRILRLTAEERNIILSEGLTERHARALLRIDDIEERKEAALYIAKRRLNVAQSEEYIERTLSLGLEEMKKEAEREGKRKFIIKDIKIFYNTLDKAIDMVKQAGIDVVSEKNESDDEIELTIKIAK